MFIGKTKRRKRLTPATQGFDGLRTGQLLTELRQRKDRLAELETRIKSLNDCSVNLRASIYTIEQTLAERERRER